MSSQPTPKLLQIHIPHQLQHYAVAPTIYLSSLLTDYAELCIGAFIFDRPSDSLTPSSHPEKEEQQARLLLIQRAATERGFPNRWEIPGGGAEVTDPSIFHSLARETFEETGLKLTRVVRELPSVTFQTSRSKKCLKLNFEIAVDHGDDDDDAGAPSQKYSSHEHGNHAMSSDEQRRQQSSSPPLPEVTLDPAEHQAYAWVTAAEVVDERRYPITTPDQLELQLQAFRGHAEIAASMRERMAELARAE